MPPIDQHIHEFLSQWGWTAEATVKLLLAAICGAMIGIEREMSGRVAGFRTNLLVCLGSALVMLVSLRIAFSQDYTGHASGMSVVNDPARIAYGVMTGIGFLGAGAILRDRGTVRGLTTAAAMWCVTAIGLGYGAGLYTICVTATVLVVFALWVLERVQEMLPKVHYRLVTVRRRWDIGCVSNTVKHFEKQGLEVTDLSLKRTEDLRHVDIELRVMFRSKRRYYQLEHDLERDREYTLMAIQES